MMEPTSEAVSSPLSLWATGFTCDVGGKDPDVLVEDFEGGSVVVDGKAENGVSAGTTGVEMMEPSSLWPTESTRGVGDADPDVPVEDFEGGSDVVEGSVEDGVSPGTGLEIIQLLSPRETIVDE